MPSIPINFPSILIIAIFNSCKINYSNAIEYFSNTNTLTHVSKPCSKNLAAGTHHSYLYKCGIKNFFYWPGFCLSWLRLLRRTLVQQIIIHQKIRYTPHKSILFFIRQIFFRPLRRFRKTANEFFKIIQPETVTW